MNEAARVILAFGVTAVVVATTGEAQTLALARAALPARLRLDPTAAR